jgi:hypothetical protein
MMIFCIQKLHGRWLVEFVSRMWCLAHGRQPILFHVRGSDPCRRTRAVTRRDTLRDGAWGGEPARGDAQCSVARCNDANIRPFTGHDHIDREQEALALGRACRGLGCVARGHRRGGALAVQNVLRGDVKGSRTMPTDGALLTGVEQVLNSAGTVHCRGVWNYTNPQNHPSIDVHITIGLGTWSITSAAGTVVTGTFRVSRGSLTATVASLHESATDPASEMPWTAKSAPSYFLAHFSPAT